MEINTSLVFGHFDPMRAPSSTAAAPDAAAMKQFSALMQAPSVSEPASATPVALPELGVTASHNVGDRILHGMQNLSSDFRESWTRVADTLRPDIAALDGQQMLGLQLHLTQVSVQYDLLGKAISRSTQNFDQLVRVQ